MRDAAPSPRAALLCRSALDSLIKNRNFDYRHLEQDRLRFVLGLAKSRHRVEAVLVVDDNGIVLSVTAAMLDRQGYRVITSISGKQAVELLAEWTDVEIDLALIDIVLGDMNGTDVAKEIRRLRPNLPIIFMTGFPEHREFLAAQGQTVLKKPFTSLALVRKIRESLDQPKVGCVESTGRSLRASACPL